MYKRYFLLIVTLYSGLLLSCSDVISRAYIEATDYLATFARMFGGSNSKEGYSIQQTDDGGYIATVNPAAPVIIL